MWLDIKWNAFFQSLMPERWRKPRKLAFLRTLISQVRLLWGELVELRRRSIYDMTITGQTGSLEHALNNRFDPEDRGIYIETAEDLTQQYIYNKVEARPPLYLVNKWRAATAYVTGEYCGHFGDVWKALADNTNSAPSLVNTDWEYVRRVPVLLNKAEANQLFDFIVWVPLTLTFNTDEMIALLDTYCIAGRRYTIRNY